MYSKFDIKKEEHIIRSSQTNMNSEMSVPAICEIIQGIADQDARERGFGYEDLLTKNLLWVMSRIHIEIDKYPKWREKIQVFTWVRTVTRSFSIRDFHFVDENDNSLVRISTLWAMIDEKTRRPLQIEQQLSIPVIYENLKTIEKTPEKIPENGSYTSIAQNTVKYTDLDIVGHVNNIRYTTWILETFSKEQYDDNFIKKFVINFNSEAKYNQKLIIENNSETEQNTNILHIIEEGQQHNVCKALVEWEKRS